MVENKPSDATDGCAIENAWTRLGPRSQRGRRSASASSVSYQDGNGRRSLNMGGSGFRNGLHQVHGPFLPPSFSKMSAKHLPTCGRYLPTFWQVLSGFGSQGAPDGCRGTAWPGQHPRRRRLEPNAKLLCADNFRAQRARWVASSPDGLGFRLGGGGRWLRWPA